MFDGCRGFTATRDCTGRGGGGKIPTYVRSRGAGDKLGTRKRLGLVGVVVA